MRRIPTAPGRGANDNPPNRVETRRTLLDADDRAPPTRVIFARSRGVLSYNDSPDVPFEVSLNPYRGCEHGCPYCYARPTHEYLGLSAGLDFETSIVAKPDAPALLRRALSARSWRVRPLALSGVTDPYQPLERRLRITRGCLEVLAEFRHPVGIVTKNALVLRDLDLLRALAGDAACSVFLSVTTLRPELARAMEPRACNPSRRLAAIARLADAGVPCGVLVAPVIPGLTDEEIPAILHAAAQAGASAAAIVLLRLPGPVAGIFASWLERRLPARAGRVLARVRALRGGRLNDPRFGWRMQGSGPVAETIRTLFEVCRRRCGLRASLPPLSGAAFRPEGQLTLPLAPP